MIVIQKTQALQRWDIIPENLREALSSDDSTAILEEACELEHVPDDEIATVSRLSGYVLLGFLAPQDLAREVSEAAGVDEKGAQRIAQHLDEKIFAPLRNEIDKIYAP